MRSLNGLMPSAPPATFAQVIPGAVRVPSRVLCRIVTLIAAGAAAVTVACRSTPTRPSGDLSGAPSARGAVERFLAAVRAQDLQAMSVVWGTKNGPSRDALP